jgi:pimeloyl-ACP methyl ester carboxylesterase
VLGAERDLLVPPDQVRSTARLMRAEPQLFPDMGHTMMLEPDWEQVAAAIDGWLRRTVLAEAA